MPQNLVGRVLTGLSVLLIPGLMALFIPALSNATAWAGALPLYRGLVFQKNLLKGCP